PGISIDQPLYAFRVVVGCRQRILRHTGRHARYRLYIERSHTAASLDKERVRMPVIVTLEFDDLVSPRITASQPDGTHTSLGAAADHSYQVHIGHHAFDQLGHLYFQFGGRSERGGISSIFLDSLYHRRPGMSQDHRSPARDIIDIAVT